MILLTLWILLVSILTLTFAAFLFYRWFHRVPVRTFPDDVTSVISPADGKVAVVKRFTSKKVKVEKWNAATVNLLAQDVAKKGWFILIVMTPFNVHVQRAPFSGTLIGTHYAPGKFLNAVVDPKALKTLENERNEMLFETKIGKIKVVQIAGFLARRIKCFVKHDQKVEKGEEIGFITFGSQVALLLPDRFTPSVKAGERVVDGETILGYFKEKM